MTDNTQELEDMLDTLAEKSADSDSRLGYAEAYEFAEEAKQAILDWHNKRVEEVLDRLVEKGRLYDHDPHITDSGRVRRISDAIEQVRKESNNGE